MMMNLMNFGLIPGNLLNCQSPKSIFLNLLTPIIGIMIGFLWISYD